jgi:Outer membrane protein beta-barrel domain
MRNIVLIGLLTAAAACAQNISVAAYAGAPFTNVESTTTISGISYLPKSPNFTVGAGVQVNLPFRLRVEFDALVRPASFKASDLTGNTSATEWRFPLIAQYRLGKGPLFQPFVGVGASFEHLYQIKNAVAAGPGSIASNSPGGMVIDGGVDLKLKLFRLSGELRYTREFNGAIFDVQELNQAEVLVGAHF